MKYRVCLPHSCCYLTRALTLLFFKLLFCSTVTDDGSGEGAGSDCTAAYLYVRCQCTIRFAGVRSRQQTATATLLFLAHHTAPTVPTVSALPHAADALTQHMPDMQGDNPSTHCRPHKMQQC